MKNYEILQDFKGSQNGSVTEDFKKGTTVPLSDYLVASLAPGMARLAKDTAGSDENTAADAAAKKLAAATKKVEDLEAALTKASEKSKAGIQTKLEKAKLELAQLTPAG